MFGGVFDLFDGALARATGKVSKLGAFMDSTFDRWGEGVVYVGIVWGALELGIRAPGRPRGGRDGLARSWSATPAPSRRAWASRPAPAWPTSASRPREVRIVILTLGLVLAGLVGTSAATRRVRASAPRRSTSLVLELALGLIAVLATITTIQRIVVTLNQASQPEQGYAHSTWSRST